MELSGFITERLGSRVSDLRWWLARMASRLACWIAPSERELTFVWYEQLVQPMGLVHVLNEDISEIVELGSEAKKAFEPVKVLGKGDA